VPCRCEPDETRRCMPVDRPPTHRRRRRCETDRRQPKQERNQASGGPREEERKAGRAGRRKVTAICATPSKVGWTTWAGVGAGVTCTDCHSQIRQCTGTVPPAAGVTTVWREPWATGGAPGAADRASECASAPNVLKNTYNSATNAASLRFTGELSDKNRLPAVSELRDDRFARGL
jgi:hypothetical protein